MATIIQEFLEAAPEGAARVLEALAAAESLTNDVAREIYELAPIEGLSADMFVNALHYADFVAPRNSEWHFVPEVRVELRSLRAADPEIVSAAHQILLRRGREGDLNLAGSLIPGYLFTNAGKAYHAAAVGEEEEALTLYSRAASGPLNGAQWLASKLADEQEAEGIIPRGRVETTFLRAMVLFREGHREDAEPLFERIASSDEVRTEVAISCHILAGLISRTRSREAEELFRKSIRQKQYLKDLPGQAHSKHSLANLIGFRALDEAEGLYRESIEILREIGDRHGVAQTLHSLANLIGRNPKRSAEAEELYRESIEIGREIGDRYGVAQRLHSLANLIGRNRERSAEAEELYRESIEIDRELGNLYGVAQTLHSFANLIRCNRRRVEEAEGLLRESLKIGEELRNLRHQAQVLRSLSFVAEDHRDYRKAESLLERALEMNQRARDRNGEQIVRRSLKKLRDNYGL